MKSARLLILKHLPVVRLALVLTVVASSQIAIAQTQPNAPKPNAPPKPVVLDEKARAFGPEANPDLVFKETKGRPALRSQGLEAHQLQGLKAGKPISSMPGAKKISRKQWAAMKEIPKTGLFLVDVDFVPPGLDEDLKRNGYRLTKDGKLMQKEKAVALFVFGETFRIAPAKAASRLEGTLSEIASAADSLFASEAEAATPFPWACGSWYFKWQYDGGFCRDFKAWSDAYAWGPGPDGSCADPKPLTRIDYISTYASIGSFSGFDYHYGADQSHAYAEWDIGCFWPAFGTPSGFHYAYWRDGSAWMYRTWSW